MRDHPHPVVAGPELRVGCAMWTHRDWLGRWLPADTPQGEELAAYATWCTTVEGNTTFYAVPSARSIDRWRAQTPDRFRFCFKLPRSITHERRLRDVEGELTGFLERIEPLADRLGPVQIQLPASFEPRDLDVLTDFLDRLPREWVWAVEVRHPGFFAGGEAERPLDDALMARGVNRVVLDSRALFSTPATTPAEQEAFEAKPRVPVRPTATATQPLVRLIGCSDVEAALDWWRPWVTKIAEWLDAGVSPHVFTHTPDNVDALPLSRRFWGLVNEHRRTSRGSTLPPLPTPVRAAEQLRLTP